MGTSDANSTRTTATLTLHDGFKISYTSVGDVWSPLLLLIVGSSGIGSLYSRVAAELSPHFRCVHYDKRGFLPKSTDQDWAAKQKNYLVSVEQQADDAAALIMHLSPSKPANIFGTSCGATEALDLTIRYPELVHTAILHEAITFSVIRDDKLRDDMHRVYKLVADAPDTIEAHAAFQSYMFNPSWDTGTTFTPIAPPPPPQSPVDLFNSRGGQYEAHAMMQYNVDEPKVKVLSNKMIIIVGKGSINMRVSRPGVALASMLGLDDPLHTVPGNHFSFASKSVAKQFCEELMLILQREGRISRVVGARDRAKF